MWNFLLPEPEIWWESRNWQLSGIAQTGFLGRSSKMCTENVTEYDEIIHSVQKNKWLIAWLSPLNTKYCWQLFRIPVHFFKQLCSLISLKSVHSGLCLIRCTTLLRAVGHSVWVLSLTLEETILLSGNRCCIKASVPGGGSLCPM